jgi:hypothetical protein
VKTRSERRSAEQLLPDLRQTMNRFEEQIDAIEQQAETIDRDDLERATRDDALTKKQYARILSDDRAIREVIGVSRTAIADGRAKLAQSGMSWAEVFPEGWWFTYKGDDPEGFAAAIKDEFKFDPGADTGWDAKDHRGRPSRGFHCPAEHLDAVYGSGRFPVS